MTQFSDGRLSRHEAANLWSPISKASKAIVDKMEFLSVGITLRNSARILARDEDGREFECCWTDHKGGYWWDFDTESPADPVEFKAISQIADTEETRLLDLLIEVRNACLFDDDDGRIGVTTEPSIDSDLFDRICAAINQRHPSPLPTN